jgi:hypothetical protein
MEVNRLDRNPWYSLTELLTEFALYLFFGFGAAMILATPFSHVTVVPIFVTALAGATVSVEVGGKN